jgi:antitoxin (DNA-binding transcriptional repressor) of toxin-antitoxin stability system
MKKTNIAALRTQLSQFIDYVLKGKELIIQKRNISIAKIVPIRSAKKNKTKLGSGGGSVKFHGDVTKPVLEDDWDMHR